MKPNKPTKPIRIEIDLDGETMSYYTYDHIKQEMFLYEETLAMYLNLHNAKLTELFSSANLETDDKPILKKILSKVAGITFAEVNKTWKPDTDLWFNPFILMDNEDMLLLCAPSKLGLSVTEDGIIESEDYEMVYRWECPLLTNKNIKFFFKKNKSKPRINCRQYVFQSAILDFYKKKEKENAN